MNTLIKANVINRIVTIENDPATGKQPVILCKNSDYEIEFTFDHEWDDKYIKTAQFVAKRGKETMPIDVVFTGTRAHVPELCNIDRIFVGVFAGDIMTTSAASIECAKSALCGVPFIDPPPPDVYQQIMGLFENVKGESAFIRFSKYFDGTDFTEAWMEGQTYIGFSTALYAPQNKEDYIWTRICQGPKGDPGETGPAGPQGAPGRTPVVGVDYFTEDDKKKIVSEVLAALPAAEGVDF